MKITSFLRNEYWEDWYVSNGEGRNYLITIDLVEKTIYCTCPDFKFRKSYLKHGGVRLNDNADKHCKHIQYVLKIRSCIDG